MGRRRRRSVHDRSIRRDSNLAPALCGLQLNSRGEEVVSLRENSLAVLCHCKELLERLWVGDGGGEKKDDRLALLLEELIVGLSVGRRRESRASNVPAHSLTHSSAASRQSSFRLSLARHAVAAQTLSDLEDQWVDGPEGGEGNGRCRRRRRSRSTFGRTEAHHHHH